MQPWPLLGIAQLIVAMNDTLPQLGTAVRMQLPGYGWVVEGSVARLEASHAVRELDSKRTSRHTRKASAEHWPAANTSIQASVASAERATKVSARQAASVRFARSVAAAKHESAGGSGHTAGAVVARSEAAAKHESAGGSGHTAKDVVARSEAAAKHESA